MKVVILAGGYGTRISEYTKTIPKPMIPINKVPILIHLINHYRKYNFNDFYIATGYKSNVIKNYFNKKKIKNCKINLIDTGSRDPSQYNELRNFSDNDKWLVCSEGRKRSGSWMHLTPLDHNVNP